MDDSVSHLDLGVFLLYKLSPCRSEGNPPHGLHSVGSATETDPAPTWLDAAIPAMRSGPPPLHQPITGAHHSDSRWPQGESPTLHLFISSSVFCFGVDFLPVDPRDPSHFLCVCVCVHVEIHLFNLKQQVATVTVMKSRVFTLTV